MNQPAMTAGDFPKAVFDLLQRQLAATGRIGGTRFYQTPAYGAIATGNQGGPNPIRFNMNGIALALYGQVASGAIADYAGTSARVQIGGTEDLFVDGQGGPAFVPFLALFGGVSNWVPLMRRVSAGDLWTFTIANAAAAGNVTPLMQVAFIADADIAAMNQRR